jgi:hypothetical protein
MTDPRTRLVGAGSSFPPDTDTRLVVEAGFRVLRDELVSIQEPDGEATFQWILAQT